MDLNLIKESIITNVYHITSEMKVPMHLHRDQDEIFYCINGSGYGISEDGEVKLEVGDSFTAHAGKLHSLRTEGELYVVATLIPIHKVVCHCHNVTLLEIKKAMKEGATTVEDIQRLTKAGTACGACIPDIKKILDLICGCKEVYKDDILEAIKNGATTLEEVSTITKAGSGCGNCKAKISSMLTNSK